MLSPRWRKILRDLQMARGRIVMMTVAIAVSIFGVGTILSAYTIMIREISRNYLDTNPASALLEVEGLDDALVQAVKGRPHILDAQAGAWVIARAKIGANEWAPLMLFVVPDFSALRINTFQPEAGAWPPPERAILLEREALALIDGKIGAVLDIQMPDGVRQSMPVAGTVHDPGLAPAWQEQMLYGYITPSTLTWLGEGGATQSGGSATQSGGGATQSSGGASPILKVILDYPPGDLAAMDAAVGSLALWLKEQGHTVEEIRIPPPLKHPHQSQMNSVVLMLLIFSLMTVVLSAILTAAMIGGLLAQQMRQIGMMKAIGARSRQITGLYLVLILMIGAVAVLLGLPPGIYAGRAFAGVVAQLLNFTLYSQDIPAWVFGVEALMGMLVPLLVALFPILKTSRVTVRETLNDYGTTRDAFGSNRLDDWLSKIRGLDNTLLLALRNTFRRRGRLILTLTLLAAAGGLFMTGINIKTGWERILADGAASRHYDLEIRLNSPQPQEKVFAMIAAIPGVQQIEAWNLAPAALYRPDLLEIVRTYPDGGHGSLTLRSAPLDSSFIESKVLSGRELQSGDTDGVVLNQLAAAFFPDVKVGDTIHVTIHGNAAALRVVGILRQILTPAAAYVLPATFAQAAGYPPQYTNAVRIVLDGNDPGALGAASSAIERALRAENIGINILVSETMLESATNGHIFIFIAALILIAVITAVVGVLGLMSSMGTSVIERTREFGVMRAIGAKSHIVLRNVISEGIFIGLMSWVLAVALSVPLSLAVGRVIGNLSFRIPLPLTISPASLGIWFLIIFTGSIAASAYPALQASRLTVRETLAYI